jgi:hypothetical protein
MLRHGPLFALLLLTSACTSNATHFYPLAPGEHERDPVHARALIVILDDRAPPCEHRDVGTIVYDWARDGVFTSAQRALDGVVEEAAQLGASGIYRVEYSAGAVIGQGFAFGNATSTGNSAFGSTASMTASGQEMGARAIAFVCSMPSETAATG